MLQYFNVFIFYLLYILKCSLFFISFYLRCITFVQVYNNFWSFHFFFAFSHFCLSGVFLGLLILVLLDVFIFSCSKASKLVQFQTLTKVIRLKGALCLQQLGGACHLATIESSHLVLQSRITVVGLSTTYPQKCVAIKCNQITD